MPLHITDHPCKCSSENGCEMASQVHLCHPLTIHELSSWIVDEHHTLLKTSLMKHTCEIVITKQRDIDITCGILNPSS